MGLTNRDATRPKIDPSLEAMFRRQAMTRDQYIFAEHRRGVPLDAIGFVVGLSRQRVHQIVTGKMWRGERKGAERASR